MVDEVTGKFTSITFIKGEFLTFSSPNCRHIGKLTLIMDVIPGEGGAPFVEAVDLVGELLSGFITFVRGLFPTFLFSSFRGNRTTILGAVGVLVSPVDEDARGKALVASGMARGFTISSVDSCVSFLRWFSHSLFIRLRSRIIFFDLYYAFLLTFNCGL
jgi:hypothetical protein